MQGCHSSAVVHEGPKPFRGIIEEIVGGLVYHPQDWLSINEKTDHDRELIVTVDEVLGAIYGVYQPDTGGREP